MNAGLNGFNALTSPHTETETELGGTRAIGLAQLPAMGVRIYLKMLLELDWKNSRHIWRDDELLHCTLLVSTGLLTTLLSYAP